MPALQGQEELETVSRYDILWEKLMSPTGLTPEEHTELNQIVDKQVAWGFAAAKTVAAAITRILNKEKADANPAAPEPKP
jgi:hypothetical protein